MSAILEDLKARALQLTPSERDELVRALIESVEGEPEETPAEIARVGRRNRPAHRGFRGGPDQGNSRG